MYFLGAGHLGVAELGVLPCSCPGLEPSSHGSAGLAPVSSLTPGTLEGLLSYMWELWSLCLLSGTRVPLCCQSFGHTAQLLYRVGGHIRTGRVYSHRDVTGQDMGARGEEAILETGHHK